MKIKFLFHFLSLLFAMFFLVSAVNAQAENGVHNTQALKMKHWDGELVQYGSMHESIGQKQHQGRVFLDDIVKEPHFYGVAALERLKGEVTSFDSGVTVTTVDADGRVKPLDKDHHQATLLAGAYVPAWNELKIEQDVLPSGFDNLIRDKAFESGFDISKPFVFTVDGEFTDVKLHVINGACPMHARLRKIDIPQESRPFEGEYASIRGKIVGVYASNAVGNLTHPDTSTHVHLIFKDEVSGEAVTGHLEQAGIVHGSTLKLPY